jgi:predicted ATPase
MAPPWPEIYETDNERRHNLDAGVVEYERLIDACPALGYEVTILPKVGVAERAEFVLHALAGVQPSPRRWHRWGAESKDR